MVRRKKSNSYSRHRKNQLNEATRKREKKKYIPYVRVPREGLMMKQKKMKSLPPVNSEKDSIKEFIRFPLQLGIHGVSPFYIYASDSRSLIMELRKTT